jgi:hypothetical protein
VKSLRRALGLLSGLCLGTLFAVSALAAQNATQPATSAAPPKYRTHFLIYDVEKKAAKTFFTVDGEWHAPNWTPDGITSSPTWAETCIAFL